MLYGTIRHLLVATSLFSVPWNGIAGPVPIPSAKANRAPSKGTVVLSEDPFVAYRPEFINYVDVAALKNLSIVLEFKNSSESDADANGGLYWSLLDADLEDEEDGVDPTWAEALERLEDNTAEWSGIARNGEEAPFLVARWKSAVTGQNRSGPLHLDARLKPERRRTVLIYLTGDGSGAAGHTVFPCADSDDVPTKEQARRQKLCSRAFRNIRHSHDRLYKLHAEGLVLPPSEQLQYLQDHEELTQIKGRTAPGDEKKVDWLWLPENDEVATNSLGPRGGGSLTELVEEMCQGRAPGLRIAPRAGAAVLFDVSHPEGSALVPDWRSWHAGCSPQDGHKRWTAQKFKHASAAESKKMTLKRKKQKQKQTSSMKDATVDASARVKAA